MFFHQDPTILKWKTFYRFKGWLKEDCPVSVVACRPVHTACEMHMPKHVPVYHLQRRAQCQTPLILTIVGIPISTFPACVNTIKAKVTIRTHSLRGAFISGSMKLWFTKATPCAWGTDRIRVSALGQNRKTKSKSLLRHQSAEAWLICVVEPRFADALSVRAVMLWRRAVMEAVSSESEGFGVWKYQMFAVSLGSCVLEFVVTWIPKLFCLTCE